MVDFHANGSVGHKTRTKTKQCEAANPHPIQSLPALPKEKKMCKVLLLKTQKKFIGPRSVELDIPEEPLIKIKRDNLKIKPYTIQVHQRVRNFCLSDHLTMCSGVWGRLKPIQNSLTI